MSDYKLDKVDSNFILLKDDIEVTTLASNIIRLVFSEGSRKHEVIFSKIEDFYSALKNIKTLKKVLIFVEENGSKQQVELQSLTSNGSLKKVYYKFQYAKELFLNPIGFADYSYASYFMPKWSTAYKFPYSNHAKVVEPLFTDIKSNSLYIKKLLSTGDDPKFEEKSKLDFILSKGIDKTTQVSNLILQGFVSKEYFLDSEEILHFSPKYNECIYIKRLQKVNTQIKVKGIQNNSFVEEIITLTDDSILKLEHSFQIIYKVELVDFVNLPEDLVTSSLSFKISNAINMQEDNLNFEKREDQSFFEIENEFLVYKRRNDLENYRVFNLGFDAESSNIYIDSLDNITVLREGVIYKGRVDAKIDLQIDRDITYNNTKYIETTYLTSSEYLVEVLVLDYIKDTAKDKVSISVKSPTSSYYLNSSSELQPSEEELFINLSELKKDKISFELNLDYSIEYITITINDIDGHYKKSSMIVHPKINFKTNTILNPRDLILIMNKSTYILDNLNLNLKET